MARRKRKHKSLTKKGKGSGASLNTVSITAFVVFCIILLVSVMMGQLTPLQALQVQENAVLESTAERAANHIERSVAAYTDALRVIAADPLTRTLINAKDRLAISNRETVLKDMFPSALRVRLLSAGVYSLDKSSEPHLGFACRDLQRIGEKEKTSPPIEVHVKGTPQQHIDMVQPILDETGNQVIGHVQLALDVALLQKWTQQAAKEGYVELSQKVSNEKTVQLAQHGDGSFEQQVDLTTLEVEGTAWQVNVRMPGVAHISALNMNVLLVMGLGIFLTAAIVLLLRRSMSQTIITDLENFMMLEADLLQGNKRHQYFLTMSEFRRVARKLDDLPNMSTMARERDSHADTIDSAELSSLSLEMNLDPMYMDESAMAVEELDDSAAQAFTQQQASPQQPAAQAATQPVTPKQVPPSQPQAAPAPTPAAPALPPAEIFKAYDIRGIVGKTLTAQHATLIGQALASEAINRGLKKIAFGRDGRLSGPELGGALVRGMQAAGVDVIDVGMVPTPVLYYAAAELTDNTGVMLTGSHNPPDYNGFKMVLGGETLSGDAIQSLHQRIETNDFNQGNGGYTTQVITDKYIQRITSDVKLKRKLKVVVDCGNGVAGVIAPKLFRALGCEVIDIYSEVDGKFPNHHPDPSQPENLKDIIELVRAQDADVGFAFDGDGDRLGVISGDGSVIWPDRLMMLFAADVLSRNHGAQIIFDIKCSSNLTKSIWEKGGEPLMWKTGHSLIKAKMKQSGALLAGEMSGHIFFKERWYGFDDGLYSGARLLEILANDLRQPRVVFASLPDAVNTPELKVHVEEGEQHTIIDELLNKAEFPDANVIMIDGLRADFEDGWGLVRASNTTPCLVLRFEGKDKQAMQRIQEKFREVLLDVNPGLSLPF